MTIIDGLGVSSLEFQSVWLARLAGPQHDGSPNGGVADRGWVEGGVAWSGFFSSGTWYVVAAAESTEGVRVAV